MSVRPVRHSAALLAALALAAAAPVALAAGRPAHRASVARKIGAGGLYDVTVTVHAPAGSVVTLTIGKGKHRSLTAGSDGSATLNARVRLRGGQVVIHAASTRATPTLAVAAQPVTAAPSGSATPAATGTTTRSAGGTTTQARTTATTSWSSKHHRGGDGGSSGSGSRGSTGATGSTGPASSGGSTTPPAGSTGTIGATGTTTTTGSTGTTGATGSTTGSTGGGSTGTPLPTGAPGNWSLAFDDEFGGTSLDSSKWQPDWFNSSMWLNGSITDPANVSVGGGLLTLTQATAGDGAAVSTNPLGGVSPGFQMGCGYIEGRIMFPGSGSTIYDWPAFWTTSQNWPATGEIDIAEGLSGGLSTNYHSGGPTQSSTNVGNNSGTIPGSWAGTWHVFGVQRTLTENVVYWDGQPIRSYPAYDNCAPQYLMVNIGAGSYGGPVVTSAQVKVDYVRAWTAAS